MQERSKITSKILPYVQPKFCTFVFDECNFCCKVNPTLCDDILLAAMLSRYAVEINGHPDTAIIFHILLFSSANLKKMRRTESGVTIVRSVCLGLTLPWTLQGKITAKSTAKVKAPGCLWPTHEFGILTLEAPKFILENVRKHLAVRAVSLYKYLSRTQTIVCLGQAHSK